MNGYAYINNQGYILEVSQEKLDLPVIQGIKNTLKKWQKGHRKIETMKEVQKLK